jgi:hypothetical protein
MEEIQIILLLAVSAVLILAVAVVILLPKEKIVVEVEKENKKTKGKKKTNKGKNNRQKEVQETEFVSHVPKVPRIKGFTDAQEVDDTRELEEFLKINRVSVINNSSREEKKSKHQQLIAESKEILGEDYITIKRDSKQKKEGKEITEKRKRKKNFWKPEILQQIREGRSKDRQTQNETKNQTSNEQSKKKKEEKLDDLDKKEPSRQGKNIKNLEIIPKENVEEQRNHLGEDKNRNPNPRRTFGRGIPKKNFTPAPIRNTGLVSASLDDMLNAITYFYGEPPSIFKKLSKDQLLHILLYLPLESIIALSRTDRYLHNFIKKEEKLWKQLCQRDFSLTKKLPNITSFKHSYKASFLKTQVKV